MSQVILIENIGPIEALRIAVPENGGLVVLSGNHGVGKSTALRAVQAALREDGKLNLRDGADNGVVSVAGAKIRVTRGQTKHGGELLVESIEGRFSLADLIDPGIIDPARADAARIKALVELSGAKADACLFADIAPEPITAKADDLVTLAAKLKQAWDQVACDAERAEANERHKAERQMPPDGAPTLGGQPRDALLANQRRAAAVLHRLEGQDKAAQLAAQKHQATAALLERLDTAELARKAATATAEKTAAVAAAEHLTQQVARMREQLRDAESKAAIACERAAAMIRQEKAAQKEAEDAEALKAALEAEVPPRVDPVELEIAAKYCRDAEQLIAENDAILRNAEQAEQAAAFLAVAETHKRKADLYRQASANIERILSEVVSGMGCAIRVANGRLVLTTDRGDEQFGDLSHGERTLQAIDIALAVLPSGGVLVIDQETFASLHETDREDVDRKAKLKNILVLAATVDEAASLTATTYAGSIN